MIEFGEIIIELENLKRQISDAALKTPNSDREILFEYGRRVGEYAGITLAINLVTKMLSEGLDE